MIIQYAAKEGGAWSPDIDVSVAEANELMHPDCKITAIRFPNGAIYDNVLAKLNYPAWRHVKRLYNYP